MGRYFDNVHLDNIWAKILVSVSTKYLPEGESLSGTGLKHVHDALIAYTGLTRSKSPVTPGDYLTGISRCAQKIAGRTTFSKIGLEEILSLLGEVSLQKPNLSFRPEPDLIYTSFGSYYPSFELYVDGEYFLTFEGSQLELETLDLPLGNHILQIAGISDLMYGQRSPLSDSVEYYSIKLTKPEITIDGDTLTVHNISQSEVDAGVFYLIRQIKNGISVSTGLTFSPPQNTYDLSELKLSPGTYTIQLEAIVEANGRYYKSSFANGQAYIILLDGVPRLTIRNKIITISSNASKFNLYVDNVRRVQGFSVKSFYAVSFIGRDLNLPVGEYSITVKAVVNDVESQASNAVIYKVELSDEPVPAAPLTEYIGYSHNESTDRYTYSFRSKISDVAYKIKVKVAKTREEEDDSKGLWTYPVRNEFLYNVVLSVNGPYEYSFAIANRFGVYGPYSEPITIDVTLGTAYPPGPPALTFEGVRGETDQDSLMVTRTSGGGLSEARVWANDVLINNYESSSFFISYNFGPLTNVMRSKGLPDGVYKLTSQAKDTLGYWGPVSTDDVYYTLTDLYKVILDGDGVAEYIPLKEDMTLRESTTFTLYKRENGQDRMIAKHYVKSNRCNFAEYITGGTYLVSCSLLNSTFYSDPTEFNKSLVGNNLIENVYIDNNPVRLITPTPGVTYTLLIDGNEICQATADSAGNLYFNDHETGIYFVHSQNRGWYFSVALSSITSAVVTVRIDTGNGINPLIDSSRVRFTFAKEDGKYIARITTPAASSKPFSYYYLLHYNTFQLLDERFTKDTVVDFTDVITNYPYTINDLYLYLYVYLDEDPTKFYSCSFKVMYI